MAKFIFITGGMEGMEGMGSHPIPTDQAHNAGEWGRGMEGMGCDPISFR